MNTTDMMFINDPVAREQAMQEEFLRRRLEEQRSDDSKIRAATADLARELFVKQPVHDPEMAFKQAEGFFAYAQTWFADRKAK